MRIRRASEYIRYTDAELTPEQREQNKLAHQRITEYPVITLAKAAPVWGPTWDRTNERLVRDEQEAE